MTDTRQKILEKNFRAIHLSGFQGTRTDKVIADLGITKGAFYHYFPDKLSLGYAIIDEIVAPQYIGQWKVLDTCQENPIDGIIGQLESLINKCEEWEIRLGCPLNNLIQEMSPLDEGFRIRLNHVINAMHRHISEAISRGQQASQVTNEVEAAPLAYYILSALEGSYGIAKSLQSRQVFESSIRQLIKYLHTLKI